MVQYDRNAERWKARVEKAQRYKADVQQASWQESGFGYQGVSPWQYEEAMRLRDALMHKFEGRTLEQAVPGRVISNRHGSCYHVRTYHPMRLRTLSTRAARTSILSHLRLVYGIGEATEAQLKGEGWLTLKELAEHGRWGKEAKSLLELLERRDTRELQDWVWHWFPKSHPLSFSLAGLHHEEEFVLLDIETLGLFGRPIILLGVAHPEPHGLEIHQWLVRSMADERAALGEFRSGVEGRTALVSYNGRAFDIPAVEERFGYYGELMTFGGSHFDLLHFSRRSWGGRLPDCRLDTVESVLLGVRRTQDVPSALVPQFYQTYLETQNVGPLTAIVAHNQQDLLSLARIFSRLCHEWEDPSS